MASKEYFLNNYFPTFRQFKPNYPPPDFLRNRAPVRFGAVRPGFDVHLPPQRPRESSEFNNDLKSHSANVSGHLPSGIRGIPQGLPPRFAQHNPPPSYRPLEPLGSTKFGPFTSKILSENPGGPSLGIQKFRSSSASDKTSDYGKISAFFVLKHFNITAEPCPLICCRGYGIYLVDVFIMVLIFCVSTR